MNAHRLPLIVEDSSSDYALPSILNFFELPPIKATIHMPSDEIVTACYFHPIMDENIPHSEVWEPSAEHRVIDYARGIHSSLSPEEIILLSPACLQHFYLQGLHYPLAWSESG